ncbi:MAG: ergothioneine biosynthesis protein EgtB [Flavobacteriales bacterium]|nr:ergothioneine biosynthesis protein EgtB [Flavobacteriales bacterium]
MPSVPYFWEMELKERAKTDLGIIERYRSVRERSMQLAAPLNREDHIPQPVVFASPPKWHLAHITWFFEEFILTRFDNDYEVFDNFFAFLFNSYYNTIGERTFRADRGSITRPDVDEVYRYRAYVDEHMDRLLDQRGEEAELRAVLEIGLNHEQQHQELFLTDLKFVFGLNPTWPVYAADQVRVETYDRAEGWLQIQEGVYAIGHEDQGFCFDNELSRHKVYIHDCEVSRALVNNAEYMEFMTDGGYERFELWLDEGWSWVQENDVCSPLYWHHMDNRWMCYTLAGLREVDPKAQLCHVNYYEADAFARWKGMRIPTEFEWEVASRGLDWGTRWEWTQSAYLPYPGFKTADGALGEYNGKFMVNQMVLRGASVATAPGHSRPTYRNFFHPQYQWQFTGIRLAR